MKVVFTGLEGQGKSLRLARKADELLHRNAKWFKKSGIMRPIASNMIFSNDFVEKATSMGIKIIYFNSLDQLKLLENCDIIIDEVGTYFDSRTWDKLDIEVRLWLAQGSKRGIELYGAAQDFAQVDISFRRLVNHLYVVQKIIGSPRPSATRPPVKSIWGLCIVSKLDPTSYNEETKKFKKDIIPSFFLITKKDCMIFDTTQKIEFIKPHYKHEVRTCEHPECNFQRILHT